jgi:hypothetical protein
VNGPSSTHRLFVGLSSRKNRLAMSGASSKIAPSNQQISLATFTQHSHFAECHLHTQESPDAPPVSFFRPHLVLVPVSSKVNLFAPPFLTHLQKSLRQTSGFYPQPSYNTATSLGVTSTHKNRRMRQERPSTGQPLSRSSQEYVEDLAQPRNDSPAPQGSSKRGPSPLAVPPPSTAHPLPRYHFKSRSRRARDA